MQLGESNTPNPTQAPTNTVRPAERPIVSDSQAQWTEHPGTHITQLPAADLGQLTVNGASTDTVDSSTSKAISSGGIAVADGLVRTASTTFQQLAGSSMSSWQGSLLSTIAVESIRTTTGIVRGGLSVGVPSRAQMGLMGIWAANAVTMTVGHLVAYSLGADQGVATMLIMASVVPGMAVDWWMFKEKPTATKLLCGAVFLGGCYIALGAPGVLAPAAIGAWVGIKSLIACQLAVNEGVRRKMALLREEQPDKHHFSNEQAMLWVGGTSLAMLAPAAVVAGAFNSITSYPVSFWVGTVGMAAAVVVSTGLSLAVYSGGKSSVFSRKMITTATSIAATIGVGALCFGESLTVGKIIGGGLVLAAALALTFKKEK